MQPRDNAARQLDMPEPATDASYLQTLLQLGQTLNASLDLEQVLNIAIEQVVRFVSAERGFILLVDEATHRVWGKAARNIDILALESVLGGRDPKNQPGISRTIVEQSLRESKQILSLNAMDDPRFAKHTSVRLSSVRSVLCVPLVAQGRTLGIVYLDNRVRSGVFNEHHAEMLTAFANQAAVAIENARLYDNLRKSIEERLQLQEDLHEKEKQRLALEEANRLKSDFLAYLSHELRNPLTTIRGYVQTLQTDPDHDLGEDIKEEFYETIEDECDRMIDLITEMLDRSRLEANRPLSLNAKPIHLRKMLDRLSRSLRYYKFWTPNHRMTLDIAENLPEIMADADKIHQIVGNLLSNAVKYSPEGGVIALAAHLVEGGVRIAVSDEGLGLSPEQKEKLFGKYERIDRDEIKGISGTGLGLFLTRHLVDMHGGRITCDSAPGQGSTFSVFLPSNPPPSD